MEQAHKNSFNDLINGNKPVLVDFFADWCGPCKMMQPVLTEVKKTMRDQGTIIKVDVDKTKQLSLHYQIHGVPTLILFKNGQIKWRQSGLITTNKLQAVISQYL